MSQKPTASEATAPLIDFSGRRVLVTGASSGLGRATAVMLDRLGAQVVLAGRDRPRLEATAALLRDADVRPFDLHALEEIPAWMKAIAAEGGPLAGLVHSAGLQLTRPLRMLSADGFQELWTVNVGAATMLVKGFRQKGVRAPTGAVVLLSSVMGLAGAPGVAAYSATKGAIVALTRSLALELAPEKLRVNAVAPGHVRTEMAEKVEKLLTPEQLATIESMHPLGLGQPDDVASAIAFLLSDAARWITGTTLVVDGGYTAH